MTNTKKRLLGIAPFRAGMVLSVLFGVYALVAAVIAKAILLSRDDVPAQLLDVVGSALVAAIGLNALAGLVIGVGGAWLYNLLAEWTGGLEFTLGNADDEQ